MLEDIQDEIIDNIKKEFEKNKNIEKFQSLTYKLIYNTLKPFKYIASLIILLIIITFFMNIINIYLNTRIFIQIGKK